MNKPQALHSYILYSTNMFQIKLPNRKRQCKQLNRYSMDVAFGMLRPRINIREKTNFFH